MKREGKLVKNTLILAIGTFLPKSTVFLTLPVLTGCLTKEEYGTYDLILILVSFILPIATLQVQTAAFRFLIDVRDNIHEIKKIVTNIYAFIIATSVVVLSILYFIIPIKQSSIKLLLCAYLFVDVILNASRQCTRGIGRNIDYTISSVIGAIGRVVFVFIFVLYLKGGLHGALCAVLTACIFSLSVLMLKVKLFRYVNFKLISINKIKELIGYSWAMVPNSLSMHAMHMSDRFVVTFFLGVASNAVYSVATKIPSILTTAQATFSMAWHENASIAAKDEDVAHYYSSMFETMFNLMAGALGLLICITPVLFSVIIRGDYGEAYNQMPFMFLAMFFYSLCAFLGGIYIAYKDVKSVGMTTMMAAICNFVLDVAFIKWIGLYAASGSTFVSYVFLFIFRMLNVRKFVTLKYNFKHMGMVLGILCLESLLFYLHQPVLNILNIVFGVVMFFLLNKKIVRAMWHKANKLLHRKKIEPAQ